MKAERSKETKSHNVISTNKVVIRVRKWRESAFPIRFKWADIRFPGRANEQIFHFHKQRGPNVPPPATSAGSKNKSHNDPSSLSGIENKSVADSACFYQLEALRCRFRVALRAAGHHFQVKWQSATSFCLHYLIPYFVTLQHFYLSANVLSSVCRCFQTPRRNRWINPCWANTLTHTHDSTTTLESSVLGNTSVMN